MNDIIINGQIEYTILPISNGPEVHIKVIAGKLRMSFTIDSDEVKRINNNINNGDYISHAKIEKKIQIKPTSFKQVKPSKYLTLTSEVIGGEIK